MPKLSITAASRIGCVRTKNEDMLLVGEWFIRNGKMSKQLDTEATDRYLFAIADGMGGHNGGDVASSEALHNLQFFFNDLPAGLNASDFNEAMCEWLNSINAIIDSRGRENPSLMDMGTTLVALAYYDRQFYSFNCGDSRIYRLVANTSERLDNSTAATLGSVASLDLNSSPAATPGSVASLELITTDHSLSNLLGQEGHSSAITNCIGAGCKNSYFDIVQISNQVQPGDIFLLCSDGLNDMISDAEIARLLAGGFDADALCQAADDAGGHDNVSVIIVKVEN